MVIWSPEKGNELRLLYDLCVAMGAPRFLTPDQMHQWLRENSDTVEAYCSNKFHLFFELAEGDSFVGHLIKVLREIYSHGRNGLSDELKRLAVKVLHTPLLLNPRSLHPIDSVA